MKKIILLLFLLLFISHTLYTQTKNIDGKKVCGIIQSAEDNLPIENIVIKNRSNKTSSISDLDGGFCIIAQVGDHLEVSALGYKSINLVVKNDSVLYLYLDSKEEELKEVIVTENKNINDIDIRKLAGSIVTVDVKKLSGRSEMDMLRLLQGQVPGLMVATSGELGTKPTIRIRGESSFTTSGNEPLFVLDGVIISSEAFLALNPNDFDEIKVLKDAAASALYGIKAANGVIEITSKRGFVGKPYISFSSKFGITFKGSRGEKMMDSKEKLELERLIKNEATPGYRYSEEYYRRYYANNPNLNSLIAFPQFATRLILPPNIAPTIYCQNSPFGSVYLNGLVRA